MNRLAQKTANTPEDSGEGSDSSPESVAGDLSPVHHITSSAWEGWWWEEPDS